jgi:hypothetical protein
MRLRRELPAVEVAESTVRSYVRQRKVAMGLAGHEIFVPQSYEFGGEAQVDWYEGWAEFDGVSRKAYIFCMRSMASGGAFHRAYPHATQQAFLEAHELAFAWFGGVFRVLRYDNLRSAVKKILRGHQREETDRFWRVAGERDGRQAGTRVMIDVLLLGRVHGSARVRQALEEFDLPRRRKAACRKQTGRSGTTRLPGYRPDKFRG